MTVSLAPNFRPQFFLDDGSVAAGAQVFFYTAGTTNKLNTYSDAAGAVANPNPIILDSAGRPDNSGTEISIFLTDGSTYDVVIAPSTDSDPPVAAYRTIKDITGDDHFKSILADTSSAANGDALVGGKKTAFANSSLSSTVGFTEHDFHESRPVYLDLDYGATLDGSDVTTEFQAAIDDIGTTGGWLIINGPIKTGAITFPSYSKWMRIDFYGAWTTTATIPVPNYVALNGLGGANGTQFQTGAPCAEILPSGSVDPVVQVTGSGKHYLGNFVVKSVAGEGIKLDGTGGLGALCNMENVSVYAANSTTSEIPLVVDHFFWIWIKQCAFLSYTNSGPSIKITQSATGSGYSGLIYMDDVILNGQGVTINCPRTSSPPVMTDFHFTKICYENGESPFLTIDATNTTIQNISIDRVEIADKLSGYTSLIDTTGSHNKIRNVSYKNSKIVAGVPIVSGTAILGLHIDSSNMVIDYTSGIDVGQEEFTGFMNDKMYGKVAINGYDMRPSIVPYTSLNIRKDMSAWYAPPDLTVTSGQLAPDGTSTAFLYESSSGSQYGQENRSGLTVSTGDWVIAGIWIKSATTDEIPFHTSYVQITVPSGVTFEKTGNSLIYFHSDNKDILRPNTEWFPITAHDKVTDNASGGAGAFTFRFSLGASTTRSNYYWQPWAIIVPASMGFDEKDIIKLKQSLVNVPANITSAGDVVSTMDHHKLRAGDGAWNGGHLMLGSYHLWVDASGNLRINSSSPTSDTDGTVVGTQT